MKKTNLRINNFFIIEKDDSYYLTDIDVLEDWIEVPTKDHAELLTQITVSFPATPHDSGHQSIP